MMSGAAPASSSLKLSRSSYGRTHAGMCRGAAMSSSPHVSASPYMGRVFVSMGTSTRRFLCRLRGGPAGAIHSVLGDVGEDA